MARKRMFDYEIIDQDSFLDLPSEAKALYFILGMEADDEGFVAPKKVLRLHGISVDSLKLLIAKDFLIPFESGVVVITDWKRNNYLDKNRIRETIYLNEKKLLSFDEERIKYVFNGETSNVDAPSVKQMLNESLTNVKPEENSIEENSIEESRREEKEKYKKEKPKSSTKLEPKKTQYAEFVFMTEDEYQKLIDTYGEDRTKKMIEILDNYKGSSGKKYKSDYRAILSWVVDKVEEKQTQTKQQSSNPFLDIARERGII